MKNLSHFSPVASPKNAREPTKADLHLVTPRCGYSGCTASHTRDEHLARLAAQHEEALLQEVDDEDTRHRARVDEEERLRVRREAGIVDVPASAVSALASTTKEILADYRAQLVRGGRAEATLSFHDKKCLTLRRLLPPRAADISYEILSAYVDTRLGENVRRTTIRKELRTLKPALKLARKTRKFAGIVDDLFPDLDDDYKPGHRWLEPLELIGLACVLTPRRMARVAFAVAVGADPGAVDRVQRSDIRKDFMGARVRGTKNENRDRFAAAPLPEQQELLRYALAHGDGAGDALFALWKNVGRELPEACTKAGIPHATPTALRHTYATWLRDAGVTIDLIGVAMGHTGKSMVERVYGHIKSDDDLLKMMLRQLPEPASEPAASCETDKRTAENDKRFRRRDSNPDKRLQSPEALENKLASALRDATRAGRWSLATTIADLLAARSGRAS